MRTATRSESPARMIGEFVDTGDVPAGARPGRGEPVRPGRVETFVDAAPRTDGLKDFTVLLQDGRVVAVRGHELRHLPAAVPGERDTYGVVIRAADREELVALFKTSDVNGIFHGEVRMDRTIA